MSSTYRIFDGDNRISTAYMMKDGRFCQTFPSSLICAQMSYWLLVALDGKHGVFTLAYPDGRKETFYPEKYTLFQDGRCVSAGVRLCGSLMSQRFPFRKTYESVDSLVHNRASLYGGFTSLSIKAKASLVTPKPERVSRWAKMTEDERDDWKLRMRVARMIKKDPIDVGLQTPPPPRQQEEVRFMSALDLMREQGLAEESDEEDSYYGEEDFEQMHPSIAMVFRALYQDSNGPIRKSHEGCDCGNC